MIVYNNNLEEFELTKDEIKYFRAIKRLEKMNPGRLCLFAHGSLSVRIGGLSHYREIYISSIQCEGGDGGDDFD